MIEVRKILILFINNGICQMPEVVLVYSNHTDNKLFLINYPLYCNVDLSDTF